MSECEHFKPTHFKRPLKEWFCDIVLLGLHVNVVAGIIEIN